MDGDDVVHCHSWTITALSTLLLASAYRKLKIDSKINLTASALSCDLLVSEPRPRASTHLALATCNRFFLTQCHIEPSLQLHAMMSHQPPLNRSHAPSMKTDDKNLWFNA